ncbi:UDP-2,4-diacetamido-2,4,6-trideoxy-beta-L-altropyranose hydrolase [Maritimibacter sp. DP1N21-5]|uniref:UDP-2,4-diacetamido-2,4, 6-trideoxy-beta-L-altropyranose hydrolase n=1 Tax=Maritimibacter sp. DP1N21-5 TaxID=2836867 RepID=UPI001C470A9E|nr:UDP-2,4-diacetamido-2,4,6-trideoxy-beta-L-altropyranose hydrolase [Maritimibacter sp. DP1N21-5]
MHVAFRVDASIDIGTGHVMRCLTLATALRERGATCVFLCRPHEGHLLDLLRGKGFRALELSRPEMLDDDDRNDDPPHAAWLGGDWAEDSRDSLDALTEHAVGAEVDCLVVDHYALDARWEKALRPVCKRLMVIDDLADRPHDCDLLLDQSLGREGADYAGLLPPGATTLLGPRYALLRPEFAHLRAESLARREQAGGLRKLLVTMGGVDKDNTTGKVLEALTGCALPDEVEITVVMGPHAPWLDKVRAQAAAMKIPTEVLVGVSDMANLMVESDLAIGAGGATTWERCCVGLPSIIVATAANQAGIAEAMVEAGASLDPGPVSAEAFTQGLKRALTDAQDPARLAALSEAAAGICDGDGGGRVLARLMSAPPIFRVAVRADSRRIWEWRQSTNSAFRMCREETSYKTHDDWFLSALDAPERVIRILMLGDFPCGYLRLDRAGSTHARVSVCLSPEVQGRGLGHELLAEAKKLGRTLSLERLDAEIHPDNTASRRLFVSAGYEQGLVSEEFLTFHRNFEGAS